jgi:lipopolysaccharide biosynthesis glycosyltransferase
MNTEIQEPVRIFVGTSPNGEDAEAEMVLEYSLRKHSSRPVDITWMRLSRDPRSIWYSGKYGRSGWRTRKWTTPFTGFRWAIPEACNFHGKAIYMDVDMVNLHDISELYSLTFEEDKAIMARPGLKSNYRFCVMLMDCEKLKTVLPPARKLQRLKQGHRQITDMLLNSNYIQTLDPRWNCLDGEDLAIHEIWHLHYTKMASQPWKPAWYPGVTEGHARPEIADLWFQYKQEAMAHNWWPKKPDPPYGAVKIHLRKGRKKA